MPLISSITGSSSDHREHWIGGAWIPPKSPDVDPVSNPADGSVIGSVPRGTAADAETALASATAALPGWSGTPRDDRLESVRKWLRLIEADAEFLSALISREVGTPIALSRNVQVGLAIDIARACVDSVSRLDDERRGNSVIRRAPAGVVAAIIPWNVPLILTLQKVVPALLAGCTVVLKPSELTPLHAAHLARLADLVSFTGSVRAGRSVAVAAAANLTREHLELGGKSASLVLDDADLTQAVAASVGQALFNSGQACLQWSRLIVPRRLVREAEELARTVTATYVVGDPAAPDTDLGPLISAGAKARVARACARGMAQGARAVVPPRDMDGLYFAPTVFSDVTMDMDLAQEEIFGPVISITTHDGDDDAVRLANSTRYGLHGSVWSSSDERATSVVRRVRAGQLEISGAPFNPVAPFGGFKESGIGRECGPERIDAFCELQALHYPVAGGRSVRAKA
ncbi:aldehyde dehydrogenase family protein [Streptomyces violaceusniger]|uniref:aldehyde dehydrogenase family protein n=1 Tax=Streptomyces violaceusniger TaxID=68280 RepID=UPI00368EDE47